jgi:hypothetical protein
MYRTEGPLSSKCTGLEGHYVQNEQTCRAIKLKMNRPGGLLSSKYTGLGAIKIKM